MRRIPTLLTVAVLLAGFGAAQTPTQVSTQPGWITAGSFLYPLDKAADTATTAVGLTSQGHVAYERASEFVIAKRHNNSAAVERANESLNDIAAKATSNDTTGLEKAIAVLQQVKQRTPDAADQGLSTALQHLRQAKQRKPTHSGLGNRTGKQPAKGPSGSNGSTGGMIPAVPGLGR